MDKKEVKQISRDLLAAWDQSVENALDEAARAEELVEQDLNEVAGMHIETGLRVGGWSVVSCGFTYCC